MTTNQSKPLTMTKSDVTLAIVASFPDGTKLTRVCDCPECRKLSRYERFTLLPCGCHGLIAECTCRVKDKLCRSCGRVFVASRRYQANGQWWKDVYEIEDPHGDNASSPLNKEATP